jgi:hypothetical protein
MDVMADRGSQHWLRCKAHLRKGKLAGLEQPVEEERQGGIVRGGPSAGTTLILAACLVYGNGRARQ